MIFLELVHVNMNNSLRTLNFTVALFAIIGVGNLYKAFNKIEKFDAYGSYYIFVNKANRSIYSGDLNQAALDYDTAFSMVRIPYFRDLKNAIIVNWKLKESSKNQKLFELIINHKQLSILDFYEEFPKEVLQNIQLKTVISSDFKSIQLKKELEQLYCDDQKARSFLNVPSDKSGKDREDFFKRSFKVRDSIDNVHAKMFLKIIKRYGFPSENNIGFLFNVSCTDTINPRSELFLPLGVLLSHFLATDQRASIKKSMDNALLNFEIHPINYANCYDHYWTRSNKEKLEYGKLYIEPCIVEIDDIYYKPGIPYTKELLDSINNNRLKIGLDSIHIAQRQILARKICSGPLRQKSLGIPTYANIQQESLAFVTWVLNNAGEKLSNYKLNYAKVQNQCDCQKILY